MSARASEHLNFPVIVCFHLSTLEETRRREKKLLDVTGTRDKTERIIIKKRKRLFCLHVRAYAFSHYCYLSTESSKKIRQMILLN